MSEALQTIPQQSIVPDDVSAGALEMAIGRGDLSKMSSIDRLKYIGQVCKLVGLNPLTKPIDIIDIKGKTVLYANKSCAEQLRGMHRISITITERAIQDGVYIVRAQARRVDGQVDEAIGAVPCYEKASPDDKANAMMKAETKAKRRVTLSICGLGFVPDETELETMNGNGHVQASPIDNVETAADRAAMLVAPTDAKTIEAEVVTEPPPASAPAPTAPVAEETAKPVQAVTSPPPAPAHDDGGLPDATVNQIGTILAKGDGAALKQQDAIDFFIARGSLKKGAGLHTLSPQAANFVATKPAQFWKRVNDWKSAGGAQ